MPSLTAPAASERLPKFDPNELDLALVHLARLCDLMVTALCDMDRSGRRPEAEHRLLDMNTLAWIARAHAERLPGRRSRSLPRLSAESAGVSLPRSDHECREVGIPVKLHSAQRNATMERRSLLKSALASVALSAPGGLVASSPAAASILKAAPFVPTPDAELLQLSARFFQMATEQAKLFDRYCAMDRSDPEAKALSDQVQGMYAEWASASDACYTTTPRTLAGAAALLNVILIRDGDNIEDYVLQPLRLLRDGLNAMVSA